MPRYSRRYSTRRYNRTGVPDRKFATVTFKHTLNLNAAQNAFNTTDETIRANDPYDPVFGIGNPYPEPFAYQRYGYRNYICYASSIYVTFINLKNNQEMCYVGVIPQMDTTGNPTFAPSDTFDTWSQLPGCAYRIVNQPQAQGCKVHVRSRWSIKKATGLTIRDWITTTGYNSSSISDPTVVHYYKLFIGAIDSANGFYQAQRIVANVVVKYRVMFWGRINNKVWTGELTLGPALAAEAEEKAMQVEKEEEVPEEPPTPIDRAIEELKKLRNVNIV